MHQRNLITADTASSTVVSDTIIVTVGTEEKRYTLHKKLLLHHSEYFRGALSGNFRETDNGVVPLDDLETDVFDIFVDWLYEKKLPEGIDTAVNDGHKISIKYRTYVLADRLLGPWLQNRSLQYELRSLRNGPILSDILRHNILVQPPD